MNNFLHKKTNHKYSFLDTARKGLKKREDFINLIEKARSLYVGKQDSHEKFKANRNRVFKCNISGKLVKVNSLNYKKLKELYGTPEGIQKNYISGKCEILKNKYGTAWLYTQITPGFLNLKKKLRILFHWFNVTLPNQTRSKATLDKKIKKILKEYKIKKFSSIIYSKNGVSYVKGVWLKELPFIYDILIEALVKPEEYLEIEPENRAEIDPLEEYDFPENTDYEQ